MTLCAPVFSPKRFQIFGFRGNIYLPAPSPLPKATFPLFPPSFPSGTFTPGLQRRLLAVDPPSRCSASPIQAGNPHPTHPPPPSTSHMPRPPARARHLPPKSPTPPPNRRRPKPCCMQYSQDLKEHLAAEKQIAAARADEVAMEGIRADPRSLEEHLAIC